MMRPILFTILTFFILLTQMAVGYPGQVIQEYQTLGSSPTGLTFDGKNLWVADHKADKLFCLDVETGKLMREIPSPGFWPMGLAWDGKSLWNVDQKQKKIFQIDPESGKILNTIDAPSGNCEGLTWDGETLWVSDARSDEIMKIDLSDGTAVQSFSSPARYPQGLTFDGRYLWNSDRIQDELYMIDPQNGEVILVTDAPGPYARGLAWDGRSILAVDYQNDKIYKLVHDDKDNYRLKNARRSTVSFTHEVKVYGSGMLHDLNVYMAIPEEMPQQEILNVSFSPEDRNTVKDRWDQKFAHFHYTEKPSESRVLSQMMVETEISGIDYFIFPDRCGTLDDIPADIRKIYTADGSKYDIKNVFIKTKSKELVGDEKNPYWMARKIFDYVRNTLEYKLEGGWNVAPVVLQRGTGSCSEYTFSFIALCRAAGVPARYVGSIVVRGDDASLDEVYHRWPEIYLPNYGWIPIDPQGGDKPLPRDRAMNIGHLSNRFLITTRGAGDSRYMGWYYNSYETYQTDPQVKVNIETFGEWEPVKEAKLSSK